MKAQPSLAQPGPARPGPTRFGPARPVCRQRAFPPWLSGSGKGRTVETELPPPPPPALQMGAAVEKKCRRRREKKKGPKISSWSRVYNWLCLSVRPFFSCAAQPRTLEARVKPNTAPLPTRTLPHTSLPPTWVPPLGRCISQRLSLLDNRRTSADCHPPPLRRRRQPPRRITAIMSSP